MHKKILAMGLILAMAMGLTACGSSNPYSAYNLEDYILVSAYKGLEVETYSIEVTDDMVEEEIQSRLEDATESVSVSEGTVEDGDTVVITYVGTIDGEEFDGGSAQDTSLTIGSGTFIDGFEDGLVGATVGGDAVTLELTFPDDYDNEDYAGLDVTFVVTVSAKYVDVVPELDMDFITNTALSAASSIEEYKEEVWQELYDELEEEAITDQKSYLWTVLVENSVVVTDEDGNELYPETELNEIYDSYISTYEEYAELYGMEYGEFVEYMVGVTEEEFNEEILEYAKIIVKQEEILYWIVDQENLTISKTEYNEFIQSTVESMGFADADEYESYMGYSFEDAYGKDTIKRYIYVEKVTTLMLDNAIQVDELSDDANQSTVEVDNANTDAIVEEDE